MNTARVLILSTSLHPESRSRLLAAHAQRVLKAADAQTSWFDCRDVALPYMDGHDAHAHPATTALRGAIAQADAVVIATGIYNYSASAVAKACVELGGSAWNDKIVGVLSASGSMGSRMAPMGLVASLMLDFRCLIVPHFPMSTTSAFEGSTLRDAECIGRVQAMCDALLSLAAQDRESTPPRVHAGNLHIDA